LSKGKSTIDEKKDIERRYAKSISLQADWESNRVTGLQAVSASGLDVVDVTGSRFLDFGQSIAILGHCHPEIARALLKHLPGYLVGGTPGWSMMEPRVLLAEELKRNLTGRLQKEGKVAYCSSGAEACDYALGLARAVTRREIVISFSGAYHGFTGATLAASSLDSVFAAHRAPSRSGNVLTPYPGDTDFVGDEAVFEQFCVDKFRELFNTVTSAGEVAAMIFEPIEVNAGVRIPGPSFWKRIFEICHEHEVLTIVDEVFTGLGRTGKFLAIDHYGVEPDIVCFGKGVGGTLPLGAILAPKEIMDGHLKPNCNSASGGNPLCCVAGFESLKIIERDGLTEKCAETGRYLKDRLNKLSKSHEGVEQVRGLGLVIGIEIGPRSDRELAKKRAARLVKNCYANGLLVIRVGIEGNVIRITPPMIVTRDQADAFVERMDAALRAM
jgi:4-aminobutyrate aminotransferase-like enzyme